MEEKLVGEEYIGDEYCSASGGTYCGLVRIVPVCSKEVKIVKCGTMTIVQRSFTQEYYLRVVLPGNSSNSCLIARQTKELLLGGL